MIRDYQNSDFEAIKRIHEANKLDFQFPNLNSPLFVTNKVLVDEGTVRGSLGLLVVAELNLWMDKSSWADAERKWSAVKALDKEAMQDAASIGINGVQCFLPPGYEKFGKRIETLGYSPDRAGWSGYSKFLGDRQ